jgi:hypothetical protein
VLASASPGRRTKTGYTSGTEFYLATGDIYATQQLLVTPIDVRFDRIVPIEKAPIAG